MSTPSGHLGTNVPPPRNEYFSEIFSLSHIKLTHNNPTKNLISAKRRYEVEKFKLDRNRFSSWKIKKNFAPDSNA